MEEPERDEPEHRGRDTRSEVEAEGMVRGMFGHFDSLLWSHATRRTGARRGETARHRESCVSARRRVHRMPTSQPLAIHALSRVAPILLLFQRATDVEATANRIDVGERIPFEPDIFEWNSAYGRVVGDGQLLGLYLHLEGGILGRSIVPDDGPRPGAFLERLGLEAGGDEPQSDHRDKAQGC